MQMKKPDSRLKCRYFLQEFVVSKRELKESQHWNTSSNKSFSVFAGCVNR